MRLGRSLVACGIALAASGQAQTTDPLDDPIAQEDLPVAARSPAGAAPVPLRLGPVLLTPRAVAQAEMTSNLFASTSGAKAEEIASLGIGALAQIDMADVAMQADIAGAGDLYRGQPDLSTGRYRARLDAVYRPAAWTDLFAEAQTERRREDPLDVERQLEGRAVYYRSDRIGGGVGIRRPRVEATLAADYRTFAYEVPTLIGESRREWRLALSNRYRLTPRVRLVSELSVRDRHFPRSALFLDSRALSISAGAEFRSTIWILSASVGANRESFDGRRISDINSWFGTASIDWNVTRLTTLSARASREFNPAAASSATNRVRSSALAAVDHEFLRNLFLRSEAEIIRDRFLLTDEADRYLRTAVSARYLASPRLHAQVRVEHGRKDSPLSSRLIRRTRAVVELTRYF